MRLTASASPGDAAGKPASMTSTPQPGELLRDADLLVDGQRGAGRLLPVAQGRVEDAYGSGHSGDPFAGRGLGLLALARGPALGRLLRIDERHVAAQLGADLLDAGP